MTTIKDVARAAGVNPSTVSRVLAGSTRISPETQAKVRAVMRELNYHPNSIARSLVRRATQTIGLVIARPPDQAFANPFFPEVMRGIGSVLQAAGYNLMLTMTASPKEERAACLRLLRQRRVDGVLLTSARIHDELIDELAVEGHPFVLIGRVPPDQQPINCVNNDNVAVGVMAVEHLLERGHRRIGLIHGPLETTVGADRCEGYRRALGAAGVLIRSELEADGCFTREGGYAAATRLLALADPPTAIFCADDAMAVGALTVIKERGLAGRVAVIGVNDDPLTAFIDPPLSTIRIPVFELGAQAAKRLLALLEAVDNPKPQQLLLDSELVIRESSAWTLK